MIPKELTLNFFQAAELAPVQSHQRLLEDAGAAFSIVSNNARNYILKGTETQPDAKEILIITPVHLATDEWYDLSFDYARYLKTQEPEKYREFVREMWGAETLAQFDADIEIYATLNLETRVPMKAYGFLQRLPDWMDLENTLAALNAQPQLYLEAPHAGIQPLLIRVSSITDKPLRDMPHLPPAFTPEQSDGAKAFEM